MPLAVIHLSHFQEIRSRFIVGLSPKILEEKIDWPLYYKNTSRLYITGCLFVIRLQRRSYCNTPLTSKRYKLNAFETQDIFHLYLLSIKKVPVR